MRRLKTNRTGHDRIQRLLRSEYREFQENIIIESPFAETTRGGRGLRQVALALTPSLLIIAADIMDKSDKTRNCICLADVDVTIESFELLSVYPLELIRLSVYRRRRHMSLKVRMIDGRVRYFELGGAKKRLLAWKIWVNEVTTLQSSYFGGSRSVTETTAASSTSSATPYSNISTRSAHARRMRISWMKTPDRFSRC